jgi:hypothetical protein
MMAIPAGVMAQNFVAKLSGANETAPKRIGLTGFLPLEGPRLLVQVDSWYLVIISRVLISRDNRNPFVTFLLPQCRFIFKAPGDKIPANEAAPTSPAILFQERNYQ